MHEDEIAQNLRMKPCMGGNTYQTETEGWLHTEVSELEYEQITIFF